MASAIHIMAAARGAAMEGRISVDLDAATVSKGSNKDAAGASFGLPKGRRIFHSSLGSSIPSWKLFQWSSFLRDEVVGHLI